MAKGAKWDAKEEVGFIRGREKEKEGELFDARNKPQQKGQRMSYSSRKGRLTRIEKEERREKSSRQVQKENWPVLGGFIFHGAKKRVPSRTGLSRKRRRKEEQKACFSRLKN